MHGKNRQEAISIMLRALREMQIGPIKSTISLHERILNNPRFRQGGVNTKFIESVFGLGKTETKEEDKPKKQVA